MKRVLTLLAAACMAVSAYGQAYEFRYNGAADVIFSYPPRGSGGRAFVHDMSNVLTINYEGDFTNGVKIGNSFWVANNGTLNTLSDAGIGTSIIENSEGWNRVLQVQGIGHAKAIVTTNSVQSGLWSHDVGWYGALAGGMVGTRSNHPFSIITNQTAKVTILSNGNMGIGTSNPQAKLSVDGNILAKEIKIKTDVSVPDYVFEPDYDLKSLAEIESYIKANKHLPEVPSAKEIQADGMDVAAMNLLLLKKVEEMTLHLIEKDKIINRIMERLEKLESTK
ncbi:hypothetical protein [Sphingobacterium siyangense]|uniref:hypothetical protein n=1 Tax=Sphingobacterium siyangense TaxID=459529 RepID=UPI003DA6CAE4